jgi:hypothetical protein
MKNSNILKGDDGLKPRKSFSRENIKRISSIKFLLIHVILIAGLFLVIGVFIGLAASHSYSDTQQKQSEETSKKQSGVLLTPTSFDEKVDDPEIPQPQRQEIVARGNRNIYSSYLEVKKHNLLYEDAECGINFSFPQITFQDEDAYLWIVESGNDRTFLSYLGREEPSSNKLDHSILLYVKRPDSTSIYWDARLNVLCADNLADLALDDFADKSIGLLKKRQSDGDEYFKSLEVSQLKETTIGGQRFFSYSYKSNALEKEVYLGVLDDKLYEIYFSEDATGSIGEDLLQVVKSINFTRQ